MNSRLQFEVFEVAYEAFDLHYRFEFALRRITNSEPLPSTSPWQMRLTELADRLQQLALRLNSTMVSEEANAAARSLRECRIAIVESFGLNESSESGLAELQRINRIQVGMASDWDASEHSQYDAYLKVKVAEILQPFWARLERLRDSLPNELKPFFEFCQMTWTIPVDLDEWCNQTSASNRQRHDRLLNVIRPELRSLLQRCVSYQPGLSDVSVSHLDIDSDSLEFELRDLRTTVRQVLADLPPQADGADPIHDESEDEPELTEDESEGAEGEQEEAGGEQEEAEGGQQEAGGEPDPLDPPDPPDPPSAVVPVREKQKIPFTDNDYGVNIYGIQVRIASDAKKLLMYLCNSQQVLRYNDLILHLNSQRDSPDNTSGGSGKSISEDSIRGIMGKVRRALRTAFRCTGSDPMEVVEDEPKHRFALNREWLATQYERIRNRTPPTE